MITRRDVFQAISDPTRREIINLLADNRHNLNSVVDKFSFSRPAIAKHLRILHECGLVEVKQDGREKFFHAKLEGLREVSDWSNQYRAFWSKKLDALGEFLNQGKHTQKKKKVRQNKKSRP